MPLPNYDPLVDGVTKPYAAQVNVLYTEVEKLAAGGLLADYAAAETLAATKVLTDADNPVLLYNPSAASQDVKLAVEASTNHPSAIYNTGSTYNLVVKDDSGATKLATLKPGEMGLFIATGATWKGIKFGDYAFANRVSAGYIEQQGAKLVYVGTAAYNVLAGAAVVNDKLLTWAATISRTGLSLSANTLYYVYLYDNSGTPAVEESTTVPVWDSAYDYFKKTGDATRRMIGWITTNASSQINKFVCVVYDRTLDIVYTDGDNTLHTVLSAGTENSAWASIDLAKFVPANCAIMATFQPKLGATSDADEGVISFSPTDLGSGVLAYQAPYQFRDKVELSTITKYPGPLDGRIVTSVTYYYRTFRVTGTVKALLEVWGAKIVR